MGEKKRILIIDDDPDIVTSVKAVLEAEGFTVLTATSGDDGVAAFKNRKPDLILCDMMMESIDAGTKVAGAIRNESKSVPIYLLSSIGDATATNIEIDKLGFNGVFQKPVPAAFLVSSLKKALGV
jgi:CheY-like chemotaxis protein